MAVHLLLPSGNVFLTRCTPFLFLRHREQQEQLGSAFDSPSGGGAMFADISGVATATADPFMTAAAASDNNNDGQFKRASPSMFDQSLDSSKEQRASDEVDFMANQSGAWASPFAAPGVPGGAAAVAGIKTDSGFISPACASSNNHSASSEDSAENQADRDNTSPENEAVSALESALPDLPIGGEDEDEEELESIEVSRLLAGSGGASGGAGSSGKASLEDLMKSANRETPTPPVGEADNGEIHLEAGGFLRHRPKSRLVTCVS